MDRSSTSGAGGTGEAFEASGSTFPTSGDSAEQSRSTVDNAKDSVKQELREVRDDAQRRAADTVNRQKHQVADRLDSIVHALGAAQQSLRDDEQSQLASYVDDLGKQVERSTGYLRNNDFGGMMRDMQNVARNNTGLFLGSTFVAGMAMGRFLRASEPEETGGELAGSRGELDATSSVTGNFGVMGDGASGYEVQDRKVRERSAGVWDATRRASSTSDVVSSDFGIGGAPDRTDDIGFAGRPRTDGDIGSTRGEDR